MGTTDLERVVADFLPDGRSAEAGGFGGSGQAAGSDCVDVVDFLLDGHC